MFRVIVALAIVFGTSHSLAQKKTYRCGNQYQERPCAGPQSDTAAESSPKADSQKEQQAAAKRREREQAAHQAKCENYTEELNDVTMRIKNGGNERVIDQLKRRKLEMEIRIGRECK